MDSLINHIPTPSAYFNNKPLLNSFGYQEPAIYGVLETLENYEANGRTVLIIYARDHNKFFKAESHHENNLSEDEDIFEGINWVEVRPHNITKTYYLPIDNKGEEDLPF